MNVLCCLSQMILCQPDLLTELTAYSPVVFIKDFRSSRDRQLGDIADTSFLTQHDDQFLVLFCLVPDAAMLRDDASANILRHRTPPLSTEEIRSLHRSDNPIPPRIFRQLLRFIIAFPFSGIFPASLHIL